jgi:hypothetical protein
MAQLMLQKENFKMALIKWKNANAIFRGVLIVLEKCANPKCSAVLGHLGDGMLFRVPRVPKLGPSGAAKEMVLMEHVWLCSECTETMTLGIDRHRKVKVIPLPSTRAAVA